MLLEHSWNWHIVGLLYAIKVTLAGACIVSFLGPCGLIGHHQQHKCPMRCWEVEHAFYEAKKKVNN